MDLEARELAFSSPELDSSFGRLEVNGGIRLGRDCDVDLKGEVKDVIQAREFVSVVLRKTFGFPEIRGRGTASVKIAGDLRSPRVTADFACLPAGFAKFDAASVEGNIDISGDEVTGKFKIADAGLNGEVGLAVSGSRVEADLRLIDGEIDRILPPLDIALPLRGRASGSFKLVQQGQAIELKGNFSSRQITLLGRPVKDCRGGLEWKDGYPPPDRFLRGPLWRDRDRRPRADVPRDELRHGSLREGSQPVRDRGRDRREDRPRSQGQGGLREQTGPAGRSRSWGSS